MPLINNPGNPLTASLANALAPFNSLFGSTPEYRGPDFDDGFVIAEQLPDGGAGALEIKLVGHMMPHQPFKYGGTQQLVKEYYPGNPEPTVQVMGARETNLTIKGRFYAKKYKRSGSYTAEEMRGVPQAMVDAINALRARGSLVKLTLGEWQRWGFIERADFDVKTLADIEYEVEFSLIGDRPPGECKFAQEGFELPEALNKDLIAAALELEALALQPFDGMSTGLFDKLNSLIGGVAAALSAVTKFIDVAITTAEDAQRLANRALGLIRHAAATISQFKRRVGALNAYVNSNPADPAKAVMLNALTAKYITTVQHATSRPINVSSAQKAAAQAKVSKYTRTPSTEQQALAANGGKTIDQTLAALKARFESLVQFAPLSRHLVKQGDTLQMISCKWYATPDNWFKIMEHNKLSSTVLVVGSVLEIPRL